MSLPFVVPETQVRAFDLYQKGQVKPATLFRNRVYVQVQVFEQSERLEAYNTSYELNQYNDVLMTVNTHGYCLWIEQPLDRTTS
ncbi:MAG: hypothetical protein AAGC54_14270 [Cyanobacteria bacterium P01_F01_bin.4]